MDNGQLVQQVNKELSIALSSSLSIEELQRQLAVHINYLIQHHFEKLISLLYRIDVSEAKIKLLLQHQQDTNAGELIASLIIERQLQKIKSRREFSRRHNDFDGEESW